jgi:hypothetical protein
MDVSGIFEILIFVLLLVWFLMDRFDITFRKNK